MKSFKWIKLLFLSLFTLFISVSGNIMVTLGQSLPGAPASIAWSPDGTMIAGSGLGLLRIWDANSGTALLDLQGIASQSVTFAASWSADSKRLVSGTDDGVVRIWSISDPSYAVGQLITTISPTNADNGFLYDVAWSPDGGKIAVGRVDSRYSLEVWDATTYALMSEFADGLVTNLAWDATSSKIAYADQNSEFGIQNIINQQASAIGTSHGSSSVSWNSGNLVAAGYISGEVSVWDSSTKVLVSIMSNPPQTFVESIAWSPDNSQIATVNGDDQIRFWDVRSGQLIQQVPTNRNVYAIDFSPDGTQLAYGGVNGTVQVVPVPVVPTLTPTGTGD